MTQWGLDTLFNPAKRHMDEEKRRLQSTREEIGDASGGKRIDLESGKVTIRRGGAAAEASDPDGVEARTDTDDGAEQADVEDEAGELDDDRVDGVDGDSGEALEPEPADVRED